VADIPPIRAKLKDNYKKKKPMNFSIIPRNFGPKY
jgi:hypothetical protein